MNLLSKIFGITMLTIGITQSNAAPDLPPSLKLECPSSFSLDIQKQERSLYVVGDSNTGDRFQEFFSNSMKVPFTKNGWQVQQYELFDEAIPLTHETRIKGVLRCYYVNSFNHIVIRRNLK